MLVPINNISLVWEIVKIFLSLGLVVYIIFALVIVRQVQIMTQTVKLELELVIKTLSIIHLIFAIGVLLFALLIL